MSAPTVDEKSHFLGETASRRDALRAKVDLGAERLASRAALARAAGTDDGAIVDRLEQLGFTGESVKVIDLLPLIHVAWADGRVQRGERVVILSIVEARGIAPSSEAALLIETLLDRRPSETYLAESLALVRDLAGPDGRNGASIVDLCARVAEASGRVLGIGAPVSATERDLIGQIAAFLGESAQERFRERLQG